MKSLKKPRKTKQNIDIDRDPQSLHPVEHSISSNIYGVCWFFWASPMNSPGI